MVIKFLGESYVVPVEWTGSVWYRGDNGEQSADRFKLVRGWCETLVREGGDDPDDYEDEIDRAIESLTNKAASE